MPNFKEFTKCLYKYTKFQKVCRYVVIPCSHILCLKICSHTLLCTQYVLSYFANVAVSKVHSISNSEWGSNTERLPQRIVIAKENL